LATAAILITLEVSFSPLIATVLWASQSMAKRKPARDSRVC